MVREFTPILTRSPQGWMAGVCAGVAKRLDVPVGLVRLLWIGSIFFLGVGFLFYFICAVCLPLEGFEHRADEPKFLGVCYRLSKRFDLDLGLLRVLAVLVTLGSVGTSLLAYVVIHLLVPHQREARLVNEREVSR